MAMLQASHVVTSREAASLGDRIIGHEFWGPSQPYSVCDFMCIYLWSVAGTVKYIWKKHLKNEFELFNAEGIVYCDQVIVYFGLEFQLNRFYCTKIVIAISATSFLSVFKMYKNISSISVFS